VAVGSRFAHVCCEGCDKDASRRVATLGRSLLAKFRNVAPFESLHLTPRGERLFFRLTWRALIISALGDRLEWSLHNFIELKIRTEIDNSLVMI